MTATTLISTLFLFLALSSLHAQAGQKFKVGERCNHNNTKMQIGTFEISGDCEGKAYCDADDGTCHLRQCRKDEFPPHFPKGGPFPPLCNDGEFCDDEGRGCQQQLPVGSKCQLSRDDQCAPSPDKTLLNFPDNVNGSVCLNFQCYFANAAINTPCVLENIPYIAYSETDEEFAFVVSRGNCMKGLYCDAGTKQCLAKKAFGASCTADKECLSQNCDVSNTCGISPDEPAHFPMWVYAAVGIGIVGGITITLFALYFVHRRGRDDELEKRTQYWREQTAMRQNILQMKETARSGYREEHPEQIASADSQIPMLPAKGGNSDEQRRKPINTGHRPKR